MRTPPDHRLNLRTILVLALLAGVLTIWQHSARASRQPSLPERMVIAVGRPLQGLFTVMQAWPRNLVTGLTQGSRLVRENEALRRKCEEAQAKITELNQCYLDLRAMVKSLGLTLEQKPEAVAARVIGLDTGASHCRATIAVERPGTVSEGDVVRQAAGLVGQVLKVQGRTAEVLLLIDPDAAVAGLDLRGRDQGIVYPQPALALPASRLKMEKIKPVAAFPDLRPGDVIVTSGLDQVYPMGIPIGKIEAVHKSPGSAESVTAIIRPFVDFFRLEYVWVLKKP